MKRELFANAYILTLHLYDKTGSENNFSLHFHLLSSEKRISALSVGYIFSRAMAPPGSVFRH